MGRPQTEVDVADIRRQYLAGGSTRLIGEQYGVSAATVRNRLIEAGVPLRPSGWTAIELDVDAMVREYLDDGDSIEAIGGRHGVCGNTVRNRLLGAGVTLRAHGWRLNRKGAGGKQIPF